MVHLLLSGKYLQELGPRFVQVDPARGHRSGANLINIFDDFFKKLDRISNKRTV